MRRAILTSSYTVYNPATGHHILRQIYTIPPELEPVLPVLPWCIRTDAEPDNCSICLERCRKGKELPCGHVFHLKCLVKCFRAAEDFPACPNCRMSFVAPDSMIHKKEFARAR